MILDLHRQNAEKKPATAKLSAPDAPNTDECPSTALNIVSKSEQTIALMTTVNTGNLSALAELVSARNFDINQTDDVRIMCAR